VNEATDQVTDVVSAEPDAVAQSAISTIGEKQTEELAALEVEITPDLTREQSDATIVDPEEEFVPPPIEFDSFLVTGLYENTVVADGATITDPGAFFQLIFNASANEGVVFFSIPDTGDTLTAIDGDQFSGLGDQFLVRLNGETEFTGATGFATVLLGNPSNSNFTLTPGDGGAATLDGEISVDYANSTLVDFLQSSDGTFTEAQVQFIQSFIEPGTDLATLQAELDQGLADFKALLQPVP